MDALDAVQPDTTRVKDVPPSVDVLYGVAPESRQLRDGAYSYTYSGDRLSRSGDFEVAKSLNCTRIQIPFWNGAEAFMLYRPSESHRWQDASSVVVDSGRRIVYWGRSDGATRVEGREDNDSGKMADELVGGINNTIDFGAEWVMKGGAEVEKIHNSLRRRGLLGGATVQWGRVGRFNDQGSWEYGIDVVQVGSMRAEKKGVKKIGDGGTTEVLYGNASRGAYREFPGTPTQHRSMVGYAGLDLDIVTEEDHRYSAEGDLWIVSYGDAFYGLSEGQWKALGVDVKNHLKMGINKGTVAEMWNGLAKAGLVNQKDDATMLVLHLPAKA